MSKKTKKEAVVKKSRLDEQAIRRFMSLSNLDPVLQESFFEKLKEEDEELEESLVEEMPEEEPAPEATDDMPAPEPEAGSPEEELVSDVVSAIADALEGVTGVEIEVEGGAAPEADEMPAPEPEMGGGEEAPLAMESKEELEEKEEVEEGKEELEENEDAGEELEESAKEPWKGGGDHKYSKMKKEELRRALQKNMSVIAERVVRKLMEQGSKKK